MKDRPDDLRKEMKIVAGIFISAVIIEVILTSLLHWHYVGITAGIISYLVFVVLRYLEMKKSFNKLADEVIKLKDHHELLTAPRGYLEYLFDVFNSIKSPNGYPFHTQQYTEILAKFLSAAKQMFIATWTIEINLDYMSKEFKEQQKRSMKSKKRILFLSKNVMKSQIGQSERVAEFLKWHKENGVELYWLDKEKLVQDVIKQGLTTQQTTEVLDQREDFILLDDDVVLFYDTRDEIKEGQVPEPQKLYSVSLITMESLTKSQNQSYKRISKVIENICRTKEGIKIETLDALKNALK